MRHTVARVDETGVDGHFEFDHVEVAEPTGWTFLYFFDVTVHLT